MEDRLLSAVLTVVPCSPSSHSSDRPVPAGRRDSAGRRQDSGEDYSSASSNRSGSAPAAPEA
eukprot:751991-Hanusia_phi.AAC.1